MHLAVHIFSVSSRRAPGLTTHRVKHLSVIFCEHGRTQLVRAEAGTNRCERHGASV